MCNQVKFAPNMADPISIKDSDSRLKQNQYQIAYQNELIYHFEKKKAEIKTQLNKTKAVLTYHRIQKN